MKEAGCFNNVQILSEILRHAKDRDGIVVIQLDISKAFDTIPHQAIGPALGALGVPNPLLAAITNSYKDLRTTVTHYGASFEVAITRGVKQDDPLSPYVFNALLNPLLEQLEAQHGYTIDATHSISCLAFADDLLLLADSPESATRLLRHTDHYFRQLHMNIAADKCAKFQITTTKNSFYISDPNLSLTTGTRIPSSTANTSIRYLGGYISPWYGLQYKDLRRKLHAALDRLRSAQLKPHQKLSLLTTYLIPHFYIPQSLLPAL
jgi:hypothetical protein